MERGLSPLLGDFSARMALRNAAQRTFKRPPEQLTRAEVPALLEGLKPTLITLLGSVQAGAVLAELKKDLVG